MFKFNIPDVLQYFGSYGEHFFGHRNQVQDGNLKTPLFNSVLHDRNVYISYLPLLTFRGIVVCPDNEPWANR